MLVHIERRIPSLTQAEQRVARWILAHPHVAAAATLADVAAAADVSEPTVIRFCRHVGLGGFRDLSRKLTQALSDPGSYVHRDVDANDSIAEAARKVLDSSIRAIVATRSNLDVIPVERAAALMAPARQLVFAGLGASGHVAADACHKFFRLGIPCAAYSDGPGMRQAAAVAAEADVFVCVSAKGLAGDTQLAAQLAKQRGAIVIALTDPHSPLAAVADLVLPGEPVEDTSVYTPTSSRLAHLAVLDALLVALALSLGPAAGHNLKASKDAISVGISA
ncbi:MAG: SIS domain-containing protein [Woeseiaceae bacterium]|nr:SIS domain-containing protein [Woeseiaceae bacterium]